MVPLVAPRQRPIDLFGMDVVAVGALGPGVVQVRPSVDRVGVVERSRLSL